METMGTKIAVLGIIGSVLILLYYIILAAERVQSMIRAGSKKVLTHDGLHKYMTILCYISLIGTAVLILVRLFHMRALYTGDIVADYAQMVKFNQIQMILLSSSIGCLLLSGMVHTEYSIPGIQFASYGVLIVAMILQVIMQQTILDPGKRAMVLIYLVAFSMAIPVVYPSNIENKNLFHVVEAVVSFVLVWCFAFMFYALYMGTYQWILHPAFFLTALLGDTVVLVMRRKEEINWFVLVSLVITAIFWVIDYFFLNLM